MPLFPNVFRFVTKPSHDRVEEKKRICYHKKKKTASSNYMHSIHITYNDNLPSVWPFARRESRLQSRLYTQSIKIALFQLTSVHVFGTKDSIRPWRVRVDKVMYVGLRLRPWRVPVHKFMYLGLRLRPWRVRVDKVMYLGLRLRP
jgi:hypothetical protein